MNISPRARGNGRTSAVSCALVLAALLGSSCFHTMVRGGAPGLAMHESSRVGWNVAWGIVRADVDAPECQHGFSQVETWTPWWGVFVEVITIGILTPQKAEYVCATPPQQAAAQYLVVPQQAYPQTAYPPAPAPPQYPAYPPPPSAPAPQVTPASLPPPPPPPPR